MDTWISFSKIWNRIDGFFIRPLFESVPTAVLVVQKSGNRWRLMLLGWDWNRMRADLRSGRCVGLAISRKVFLLWFPQFNGVAVDGVWGWRFGLGVWNEVMKTRWWNVQGRPIGLQGVAAALLLRRALVAQPLRHLPRLVAAVPRTPRRRLPQQRGVAARSRRRLSGLLSFLSLSLISLSLISKSPSRKKFAGDVANASVEK